MKHRSSEATNQRTFATLRCYIVTTQHRNISLQPVMQATLPVLPHYPSTSKVVVSCLASSRHISEITRAATLISLMKLATVGGLVTLCFRLTCFNTRCQVVDCAHPGCFLYTTYSAINLHSPYVAKSGQSTSVSPTVTASALDTADVVSPRPYILMLRCLLFQLGPAVAPPPVHLCCYVSCSATVIALGSHSPNAPKSLPLTLLCAT